MNILKEQILLASNFFLSFPDLGYFVGVFLITSHLCSLIIMNFDFFKHNIDQKIYPWSQDSLSFKVFYSALPVFLTPRKEWIFFIV